MTTNEVLNKLIAEIDKRIEETKSMKPSFDQFWAGQISAFKGVKNIIASLQQEQPEVDLEEKEIEKWWQNWTSPPRNEYAVFNKEEFINLARHFYELGLNARKEDKK